MRARPSKHLCAISSFPAIFAVHFLKDDTPTVTALLPASRRAQVFLMYRLQILMLAEYTTKHAIQHPLIYRVYRETDSGLPCLPTLPDSSNSHHNPYASSVVTRRSVGLREIETLYFRCSPQKESYPRRTRWSSQPSTRPFQRGCFRGTTTTSSPWAATRYQ